MTMKKNLISLLFITIAAFAFSGCAQQYVEVKSPKYATLKLVPHVNTLLFSDYLTAQINDYEKGCQDMVDLGYISTNTDTPSKAYKIPVNKPLMIKVTYMPSVSGAVTVTHSIHFVLKPQQYKNYVVEYFQKDKKGNEVNDFYVYTIDKKGKHDIPESQIRDFNYRECM